MLFSNVLKLNFAIFFSTLLFAAPTDKPSNIQVDPQAFSDYWYKGKAEITRYQLEQARYGEIHNGDAVMIFVTEDFLKKEQVKHEFGNGDSYPVLKLNATRNFNTGLYPYSLMTSVFTSVDFSTPKTQKVTFSGQEWCGHVFMQLNRKNKNLVVKHFSYFQAEGDNQVNLPLVAMEDDIWTRIRMAPNLLPEGNFQMLPSLWFTRLLHKKFGLLKAKASLEKVSNGTLSAETIYQYTLTYPSVNRTLKIAFQTSAPYKILGWEDTYQSGFGASAKTLVTKATKTHEMMTDYWSKNKNKDLPLRKQLGLE